MQRLQYVFELMNCEYRKFKTCKKLACMQTVGGGDSEGAEDIPIHQHMSSKDCVNYIELCFNS